jgi:hypothetical protein
MTDHEISREVNAAIRRVLDGNPKMGVPMNALLVWTELGKGLCGTLERKGADVGLLGRLIAGWCSAERAADVPLAGWLWRLEPDERLTQREVGDTLRTLEREVVTCVRPILDEAGDDGPRRAFITVVRGWFPVGVAILGATPRGRSATREELLGALAAWCDRFLPRDPAGPSELGVRVVRSGSV